jgi:hypothetical protein
MPVIMRMAFEICIFLVIRNILDCLQEGLIELLCILTVAACKPGTNIKVSDDIPERN